MAQKLEELVIREMSLVDRPANSSFGVPHARVVLFKRDSSADNDFEDAVFNLVQKDGKTYSGTTFPKSDFAYTPDDTPSHWKLRLTKVPGGAPDAGIVGAACAALGTGFRGKKVDIPTEALAAVKAKVKAAWKKANPGKGDDEMPEAIRKGESAMTIQEIEKRQQDQEALLATLKAESDIAKAETETVLKMSKKDRKLYASLPAEKRKDFMAADADKRKGILDDCATQKKTKKITDSMDLATKAEFAKAGPARQAAMLAEVKEARKAAKVAKKIAKAAKKIKGDSEDPDDGDDSQLADDMNKKKKLKAQNKALTMKMAGLEDQVTKSAASLTEIEKRERIGKFAAMAEKELPHTPGTPVEKGETIMKMADAFGGENSPEFKRVFDTMKSADKVLSNQFHEIGKVGGMVPAEAAFNAKVAEIAKRDNITQPKAVEKALQEAPELYQEYEHAQRQAVRSF